MKYKIRLVSGSFFFCGNIAITGVGSEIEVDAETVNETTLKSLRVSESSGIIKTDIPIEVVELTTSIFFNEGEIEEVTEATEVAQEVEEVKEEQVEDQPKRILGRRKKG
jgi:hypothetical protein